MVIEKNTEKRPPVFKINYREIGILYALIILWVVICLTNENFRNIDNYISILRESSFVGVTAIGMTLCIISGNFDLSVGSMMAFLAVITLSNVGFLGLFPTIIIILLLGFILGMLNGVIITKLKIPAFITTLATFFIFRSFAYIYCNGNPVLFQKPWFTVLGNGIFAGLPVPFIIFVGLAIIGTIILRRTPLGRYILAIGNSEKASNISGIHITKVKIVIFGLVGVFTAASAILLSSRLWSANPGMKEGYELEVIAAVVLGGTSLAGGKGSIFNTVIAAIFMATLNTTMNMFHVDSYIQRVMIGFVLVFAFSLTGIRQFIEDKMRVRKSKNLTSESAVL